MYIKKQNRRKSLPFLISKQLALYYRLLSYMLNYELKLKVIKFFPNFAPLKKAKETIYITNSLKD